MHPENQATCTRMPTQRFKSLTWGTAAPKSCQDYRHCRDMRGHGGVRRGKRAVSRSGGAIARPREMMLRETAGNSPRFTRCPEPHGSLGPGFRARRYRSTPRLSRIYVFPGMRCSRARFRRVRTRSPPPAQRGAGSSAPLAAARRRSPSTAAASRPPAKRRERSRAGSFPAARPPLPSTRGAPVAGKARVAVPWRALTYTDGVGEPRQSLPQQPRQQQQEGPGRALPHLLQPLRFSP